MELLASMASPFTLFYPLLRTIIIVIQFADVLPQHCRELECTILYTLAILISIFSDATIFRDQTLLKRLVQSYRLATPSLQVKLRSSLHECNNYAEP